MSQTTATPRPPRPHRGSWKGGPNSHPRANNATNTYAPPAVDEPEELRALKGKHGDALKLVREIYPDWTDEDVLYLLEEVQGDVSVAVSRISEGHAERWSSQTGKKKKEKHVNVAATAPNGKAIPEGAPNGPTFAGGRGMRGGRGGGRGGFTGVARGGRGGFAGGRGGGRKRDADVPSAAAPATVDVPVADTNGWGEPTQDAPAAEDAAGWGADATTTQEADWDPVSGKQKNNIAAWAKGGDKTGWEDTKAEAAAKKAEAGGKGAVTAAPTTAAEAGSAPGIQTPVANGNATPAPIAQKSSKVPSAPKLSWAQIAKPQPKPIPPPPAVAPVAPPPLPTPPISDETPLPPIPISKNPALDEPEEPTTIQTEPAWALAEPATTVGEIGTDAGEEDNLGGETWEQVDKVAEPEPVTTVADLNDAQEAPAPAVSQPAVEQPKAKLPISPGASGAAPAPPGLTALKAKPNLQPRSSSARFKIGDDTSALPSTARWASPGLNMMFGSLKVGEDGEEVFAPAEQAPAPVVSAAPQAAPAPGPENLSGFPPSQSQPLPPKPDLSHAAYHAQPVAPPQPVGLPTPAAPQPTTSAAAGLSNVQHLFNASLSHPPPASAPLSGSLQTQQSQAQHLPSIPSQAPHMQQQHTPSYQVPPQQQQQPTQQPSYLSGLQQQQSLGGLPSHLDSHSPLPPAQSQQQHTPLGQQQATSSLGQGYYRQEQQPYYHAPTPPQTAPSQQDHLPSSYSGFGGQTSQNNLPGFGGSSGIGNDYGYGANERNFYDSYNQTNFRNIGHDDHKLSAPPTQPSLQSQPQIQNQQQSGPQIHAAPAAPSQQPAGQNQPGQNQQQQQFPGMPAPAPYAYYPSPYYMQNQYYGQPMPPGYGQPFVPQYPKYGGPPAQAPASKPAPTQNATTPYAGSYHPGQTGALSGYDDATPAAYGGASNSLDFKYTQGLQNFLGVPGSNSSLLGGAAGAGSQQRGGSNIGSGAGALQDRYTASAQSVDKAVPTPSQGSQLGQAGRPGVGQTQSAQSAQQPQQGANQQQGGGYYNNRYGNTPQNQGQGAYPAQGDNQFYQHYGQRQYWQQ
ncbi:hypothetical protein CALCODRAFT_493524 [Calocera cornea HHB12733]|uniref:RNA polymerase II degradation factor 1 n=1 Tax=Calocera cornea HHB12733 TaxID=1353952 RepID=A0A165HPU6_9BASI|nr:hypothetical protein CALCODRAFT_493524 [Calocera cornea HHB12733]